MANYFVLIDGMAETAVADSAAAVAEYYQDYPALGGLQQHGQSGLFITCPDGFVAESMTCILTLLGVPPQHLPKGRAYLEAVSQGIPVEEEDLILRCNLVAVQEQRMFSSSATGLTGAEMQQAAWQVKQHCDGQTIQFFPMQDYKNLLVVKQGKKAMQTLNTKAPHENLQRPLQAFYPSGGEVAAALQLFIIESRRYLAELWKDKPYEYWLIPWGQSCVQPVPTLQELFHCAGAVICGTEIVKGIGVLMGMTVPPLRGATADVDTNLSEKVAAALAYGKDYPLVLLHVNGADEAGHRKNQQEKQNFLRQIDQKIVAVLQQRLQPGDRLLICSDHGTNAKTGQHEGSPQPFLLYEKEGKQRGYLGCLDGKLAVPLLSGEACKSIRRIG